MKGQKCTHLPCNPNPFSKNTHHCAMRTPGDTHHAGQAVRRRIQWRIGNERNCKAEALGPMSAAAQVYKISCHATCAAPICIGTGSAIYSPKQSKPRVIQYICMHAYTTRWMADIHYMSMNNMHAIQFMPALRGSSKSVTSPWWMGEVPQGRNPYVKMHIQQSDLF